MPQAMTCHITCYHMTTPVCYDSSLQSLSLPSSIFFICLQEYLVSRMGREYLSSARLQLLERE